MDKLLPDAPICYRMLSVDWGWTNMACVAFELNTSNGELHVFLSPPFSIVGDVSGQCAQYHPEWTGAMAANAFLSAQTRYQDPSSPLWMLHFPHWQVPHPISEIVLEAGNPPRPDSHALIASVACSLHCLFPRASIHQAVRRQDVMSHAGIKVGAGRAASKEGSLAAVRGLEMHFFAQEKNARKLLESDHVCDALLMGLYVWRGQYRSLHVHGPASCAAFRPTELHSQVLARV